MLRDVGEARRNDLDVFLVPFNSKNSRIGSVTDYKVAGPYTKQMDTQMTVL